MNIERENCSMVLTNMVIFFVKEFFFVVLDPTPSTNTTHRDAALL